MRRIASTSRCPTPTSLARGSSSPSPRGTGVRQQPDRHSPGCWWRRAGDRGSWRPALSPRLSDRASRASGAPFWPPGDAHETSRRSDPHSSAVRCRRAHNTGLSRSVSACDTDGGASYAPTRAPVERRSEHAFGAVVSGAHLLPGTNSPATSMIRSRSIVGTRPGNPFRKRTLDRTRCGADRTGVVVKLPGGSIQAGRLDWLGRITGRQVARRRSSRPSVSSRRAVGPSAHRRRLSLRWSIDATLRRLRPGRPWRRQR